MKVARISDGVRFATAIVTETHARLVEPWRDGEPMLAPFFLPSGQATADPVGITRALTGLRFLPPLNAATKVICLGLNYRDHIAEVGKQAPPSNPALFAKFPDALVGHGEPLLRPRVSSHFDFEGEIALVIGRSGRHIPKSEAMAYVYGFTLLMDGSVRDYQQHSPTAGKCFHRSGAIGPWIVTCDALGDYSRLALETRLNGNLVQSGRVDQMIYDIPTVIEYVSSWTPLSPGDIISTGTPSGVGCSRKPPLWLRPRDVIEVSVAGIGTLQNIVADEAR